MDYKKLINLLCEYEEKDVNIYINYLQVLENEKDREGNIKNKWFKFFKEEVAFNIFNKVNKDGILIDGEMVTLQFKGKVMASYNYQAYKNMVLKRYPETKFDIQLVHEGDDFSFIKDTGKVIYTHKINNPFNKKKLIGCYCIIKNTKGEFIETLDNTEIKKMKQVAKTKNIWDNWEGEMYLKSVIKRSCKRHFKDVVQNAESIDNENYELGNIGFDNEIQKIINLAKTEKELENIYKKEKNNVKDQKLFIKLLKERKEELNNDNL